MSARVNDKLSELIDNTMVWASTVSEMWTGTQWERVIDTKRAEVIKAVERNDLINIQAGTYDLAVLLDEAETAYEGYDEYATS